MSHYLTVAKRAARTAGAYVLAQYGTFDRARIQYKARREIVTSADRGAERMIVREIRRAFPDHGFLTEEKTTRQSRGGMVWIVDPIDGTGNFATHNPLFSVTIAYADAATHTEPTTSARVGVIYFPLLREFYWSEAGKGAFCNARPLRVSTNASFPPSSYTVGHMRGAPYFDATVRVMKRLAARQVTARNYGCATYHLTQVAAGHHDFTLLSGFHAWDIAAGILMIREAGGRVTDERGLPWTAKSLMLVASNGRVHDRVLKILK